MAARICSLSKGRNVSCEGYTWKPPVHMKMHRTDLFGYTSLVLFVFLYKHFSRKGSVVLRVDLFAT